MIIARDHAVLRQGITRCERERRWQQRRLLSTNEGWRRRIPDAPPPAAWSLRREVPRVIGLPAALSTIQLEERTDLRPLGSGSVWDAVYWPTPATGGAQGYPPSIHALENDGANTSYFPPTPEVRGGTVYYVEPTLTAGCGGWDYGLQPRSRYYPAVHEARSRINTDQDRCYYAFPRRQPSTRDVQQPPWTQGLRYFSSLQPTRAPRPRLTHTPRVRRPSALGDGWLAPLWRGFCRRPNFRFPINPWGARGCRYDIPCTNVGRTADIHRARLGGHVSTAPRT